MHVDELLEKDGGDFVGAAYLALLKRPADPAGGQNYLRMLCDGVGKVQILHSIYVSAECRPSEVNIVGLVDAFADRSKVFEAKTQEAALEKRGENPLTISDLLSQDGEAFIASAYQLLLRRPVDREGLANCKQRLVSGASKSQILYELSMSAEFGALGVKPAGLFEALSEAGLTFDEWNWAKLQRHSVVAASLEQLLKLHGANFIESAFRTLLGRSPTQDEFQRHFAQLMNGCSKLQILDALSAGDIARANGANVKGLSPALAKYKIAQIPLLGPLISFLTNVDGNSSVEKRIRSLEQQIFSLGQHLDAKINKEKNSGRP